MFYEKIVRPLLFKYSADDPEKAHEKALALLGYIGKRERLAGLIGKFSIFEDPRLEQEIFGLKFRNPIGLAAGFDTNAVAIQGITGLGFGFNEVGTVTQYCQEGYPRPRIFRFPKDEALINRMGFPNQGADIIAKRLSKLKKSSIPLGINLGKSMITPLDKATDDYLYSLRKLYPYGDYFVVNVSSPNTPGLRELQGKEYLDNLLSILQTEMTNLTEQAGNQRKPLLVKISPDLGWEAIDELVEVCLERKVAGLIVVNTTITRDGLSVATIKEGGLSGRPLWPKAISVARYISQQTKGTIPIIGAGGIFGPEETYEILKFASLIQILTGFVYKGPFIARQINKGLKRLMDRDGIKRLSELRG